MTGEADVEVFVRAGVDGIMLKPVKPQEMLSRCEAGARAGSCTISKTPPLTCARFHPFTHPRLESAIVKALEAGVRTEAAGQPASGVATTRVQMAKEGLAEYERKVKEFFKDREKKRAAVVGGATTSPRK